MNRLVVLATVLAIPATLSLGGCRGGAVKELTEQQVAEALVSQSISTYNEVAVSVSVNDRSVDMSCASGGSVEWSETSTSESEVCYTTDSRGCAFATGNGRSFTVEGESTLCGSDDFAVSEGEVYSGQDFRIAGNASVDTESTEPRSCDYDLAVSNAVTRDGGSSYDVTVEGTLCGRPFSTSFDVYVTADIEVE